MYEYQYALLKHRLPDVRYEETDARSLSVKSLLQTYAEVYLVLTHPALTGKHTLRLKDAEALLVPVLETVTVAEWLIENANTTLPTVPGVPKVEEFQALARDIWQAGFKADLCVAKGSPFNDATDYDKTDIWLTRDDTDYVDLQRHCLATVNGLVHRLDADRDGAYIKDGGITFRKTQNAMLGLISFKNIGRVYTVSITPEMVYQPNPTKLYADQFYLKLPFDTTDKVVGIVIGGYLHLCGRETKVTGPQALRVDMNRIPFLERYMESRYLIDQSAMERFHEVSPTNETDYDLQNFHSNECILELLGLSQSFVVAIETDHLLLDTIQTSRTFLPGRFYLEGDVPLWPLRTQLGLLPSYIKEEENGVWVLRTDNNLHQHRLMDTYNYRWQPKVNERRVGSEPATFHRGEMLKWSYSKLTIG